MDAAALFQQTAAQAGIPLEIKREPNDGYWSEVWNVQPFCASYWGGRPVQDQMYATAYLSTADWNDTRFKVQEFDDLLFAARAELDPTSARTSTTADGHDGARRRRPDLPDVQRLCRSASSNQLDGWETDPNGER